MAKEKNFWISYSDLMTNMFFIILVLFIVTMSNLRAKQASLKQTQDSLKVALEYYKRIIKIDSVTKLLDNETTLFRWNDSCKQYELLVDVLFPPDFAIIPNGQTKKLVEAGRKLQEFVDNTSKRFNVKYTIVIEGRTARFSDKNKLKRYANITKDLSYDRAKALYDLWIKHGIRFNPKYVNVQIAGSGFDGNCRYSGKKEYLNRRFLVYIIPRFDIDVKK